MPILQGQSLSHDPVLAVQEILGQIGQKCIAFVLFFCSPGYDPEVLAKAIGNAFPSVPVLGCTSAGEFGPEGYSSGGISAASFPADRFTIDISLLPLPLVRDSAALRRALLDLKMRTAGRHLRRFALLLAEGLSGIEEGLSHACQSELQDIPVLGGSAGDDELFGTTSVYYRGAFHPRHSLVAVVSTTLRFKTFLTHHFFSSGNPLVVTGADASQRIIHTINGRPAAEEYARALGVEPSSLGRNLFAQAPFVVRIDGTDFVRSIKTATGDGSISLYCAIKRGVVLRIGRKSALLQNRLDLLASLRKELGHVSFILGFECLYNRREAVESGEINAMGALYQESRMLGFNTYGEQYQGLHMNQTLTGIAFAEGES